MPPRSFKPTRERKQKHRKAVFADPTHAAFTAASADPTISAPSSNATPDPNATVVLPQSKAAKEARRAELQAELRAGQPKMSSKKKKRLDKYIANKLHKEETGELIAKLAQNRIDTSLLRSTRELGMPKESRKQRTSRALAEERAGIAGDEARAWLYKDRVVKEIDEDERLVQREAPLVEELTGEAETSVEVKQELPEETEPAKTDMEVDQSSVSGMEQERLSPAADSVPAEVPKFSAVAGSGLKRPLETGSDGMPIIKRIKKERKPLVVQPILTPPVDNESSETETDSGGEDRDGESEGSSAAESDEEEERKGFSDTDVDGAEKQSKATSNLEEDEEWKGFSDTEVEEQSDGAEEQSNGASDAEKDEEEDSEEGDSDTSMESGLGDDGDDGDEKPVGRLKKGKSEKANEFKAWAQAQKHSVLGGGVKLSNIEAIKASNPGIVHIPRKREEDLTPPPEPAPASDRKAYYVTVERSAEVQAAREQLPVFMEEQQIMEAIHSHNCVVIHGETGSGKTTQVPQFLYEAGYGAPGSETPGLVGVTQPRRVAAQAMARRVGEQLGVDGQDKVSYQIRFDGTVSSKTAIKFMTDGVLLRELSEDFSLKKYSAVIIDEAHERSINTDILIGAVSRVLKLREAMSKEDSQVKPLKLIIMSATLRVSDFTENKTLFEKPPPLLTAEGRQFPVTPHFSKHTLYDYTEEAYKKVCKIHRRLPPGGILVFLTGQDEITTLLRKLKDTFPSGKGAGHTKPSRVHLSAYNAVMEAEDMELGESKTPGMDNNADDDFSEDDEDLDVEIPEDMPDPDASAPLHVLPLYSLLPTNEQMRVFDPPPSGSRLCVIATNVAETSLTIPGISYVVDCGRSKERHYDKATGVQSFSIQWISKASAEQRSGRAGRTGPGHTYRLYSSAVFERDFAQFSEPEILRMPIEGLVLQMKAMHIDTIVNFPFPTPPDRASLAAAEKLLGYLGAIHDGQITELGKAMNAFPVSPRFGKVLILGRQRDCMPYVIALVAALSVGDVFIPEHQLDIAEDDVDGEEPPAPPSVAALREHTERANRRRDYFRAQAAFAAIDPTCDALKLLSAVCAFEYSQDLERFSRENFLRIKALNDIHKFRRQLTNIVNAHSDEKIVFAGRVPPPSAEQIAALRQMLAAGFIDHLAIRADLVPNSTYPPPRAHTKPTAVPYLTLFPSSTFLPSSSSTSSDPAVYIHPSSVLASAPDYLIYADLHANFSGTAVRMKPLTPISDLALARLCTGSDLLTASKPLKPWTYMDGGNRRVGFARPVLGAAVGRADVGWPLQVRRVTERKEGRVWVLEKVEVAT